MKSKQRTSTRQGSLLIDVLLAVVIFGAVVAAFSSGVFEGRGGAIKGGNRIRATYLAEEGLEVLRSIRDQDGGYTTIASRTTGQDDGIKLVGTDWEIVDDPTTIDNFFTRSVQFAAGSDSNGNDRIVSVTVTWTEVGSEKSSSVTLNSLLTNWGTDPPPPPPDWSQPIVVGSFTDLAFDEPSLEDVVVKDGYAFIAASQEFTNGYGMYVIDATDPTSPSLINSVDLGSVEAFDIALYGNYVYIPTTDAGGEIKIVDISTPASANCSPCAGTIDLPGTAFTDGVAITGTGLFITRVADGSSAELYVYDIGNDPTSPALLSSYETDPSTDDLNAAVGIGSGSNVDFIYIASSTNNDEELRVVSLSGGTLTGNGSAGSNAEGTAVAVYGTGAFVGAVGSGDACELYSFDIAGKMANPNAAPTCGGGQGYDLAGDSDASEQPFDMEAGYGDWNLEFPHLFMATNTQRSGVNHFLHILNVGDVHNISSLSKKVYDGDITAGYGVDHGLKYYYANNQGMLFMVGGGSWATSHLLILKPTIAY